MERKGAKFHLVETRVTNAIAALAAMTKHKPEKDSPIKYWLAELDAALKDYTKVTDEFHQFQRYEQKMLDTAGLARYSES